MNLLSKEKQEQVELKLAKHQMVVRLNEFLLKAHPEKLLEVYKVCFKRSDPIVKILERSMGKKELQPGDKTE